MSANRNEAPAASRRADPNAPAARANEPRAARGDDGTKHGNPSTEHGSPKPAGTLLVRWVERMLATVSLASHRYPWLALLAVAILTVAGLKAAGGLTLDADLTQLLPESFQSVQDIDKLKERFGGVGYVVVVAMGAEPEELKRFAHDIAPSLEHLDSVLYVDYKRPTDFFRERALYFLDIEDLVTIRDTLQAREAYERRTRNPLFLNLDEDEQPPSIEFKGLRAKYKAREEMQWLSRQGGDGGEYYLDPNKRLLAIFLKPSSIAADLAFAGKFVGRVQKVLDGWDMSKYSPALKIGLTGRYTKKVDQQAVIQRDLKWATLLAAVLVLLYLGVHFKRTMAVVLIMAPLILGLLWTYGYAGIAFGSLNVLTAFIGAILTGLGIDHGIHLMGRYEAELQNGSSAAGEEEAIRRTFTQTGRAVVIAALTTTVGFAGLSFSEFRAFREFGAIAAVGMVLVVAAYTICLPALLGLLAKTGWRPHGRRFDARSTNVTLLRRFAKPLFVASLLALVACALLLPKTRFDYDFNALESNDLPSMVLDKEVNEILGYSQTPSVVLSDNLNEERMLARALRESKRTLGERSTIDFVASSTDFVPHDQEAKQPLLREIGTVVGKVQESWLDEDQRPLLGELKRMVQAEPYTRAELPLEVRRQFEGPSGEGERGFVLMFPSVSMSDGARITDLANEVRALRTAEGKRAVVAGEAMVLADILHMVAQEAPPVLSMTLVAVFLTLWLLLGRLRDAMVSLAPALATLVATLGLLPLVGVDLNYLNIVLIPVLFGIGIDGGAHLVTRLSDNQPLDNVLAETGRAIAGAILTTALGFGALTLAHHKGLNSLGALALIGLAMNLFACLVALPAFLAMREKH